jgi:adenine-specific DNA-methyltransferase
MTMKGRIKCIFVDPPYDTGYRDWAYNDDFRDPSDPFHDITWLEFLHRRFLIARDLLADDGVMFICINDEKRALLELMLDATLPGMKVGSLVWRTRAGTRGEGAYLSGDHEHVLAYAGSRFRFGGTLPDFDKYTNPDNDPRG